MNFSNLATTLILYLTYYHKLDPKFKSFLYVEFVQSNFIALNTFQLRIFKNLIVKKILMTKKYNFKI